MAGPSRFTLICTLLGAASCGTTVDRDVREYVRLAVALGERDPDSIDFYYGPPEWVAATRRNPPRLEEIRARARKLARELESDTRLRSKRLTRQIDAIAARADELLGERQSFDQRSSIYFGVTASGTNFGVAASGASQNDGAEVRAQLDHLLDGKGSLAGRYAAFDEQFLVPADRLPSVMARAMQGCREQTGKQVRLPAGESVQIEYVRNKPWSAFSRYQGNFRSVMSINADFPLTVDRALQLACHESYPGHHLQNVLQEIQFVRDNHWMEWTVQPAFSPQSLVSEALATFAVNIAFPGAERMRFERDALFPLAGIDPARAAQYDRVERLVDRLQSAEPAIARDFLDGKLEWARAAAALEDQAVMAHPEQTLKYISEYRTYMITYTLGPELVARQVHDWRQFTQLMTDPNAAERLILKR